MGLPVCYMYLRLVEMDYRLAYPNLDWVRSANLNSSFMPHLNPEESKQQQTGDQQSAWWKKLV